MIKLDVPVPVFLFVHAFCYFYTYFSSAIAEDCFRSCFSADDYFSLFNLLKNSFASNLVMRTS